MNVEIIQTSDQSSSLYVPALDETYHSRHGAKTESLHVFLKNGLSYCLDRDSPSSLRILEIGLGTGLNVLLTWAHMLPCQAACHLYYHAVEKYPLPAEVTKKLHYTEEEQERAFFLALHEAPWGKSVSLTDTFTLRKQEVSLMDYVPEQTFDLVYFDAFSPEKQPEMWSESVFFKIYKALSQGGVLVTYCAKGVVRRTLQLVGFSVERLAGPPGKREVLRAVKPL